MNQLPSSTRWVIVGAGFAGASTAWALAREGQGPGIIFEREPVYGYYASGRNAALLYHVETDPVILALVLRSARHLEAIDREAGGTLVHKTGSLTLAGEEHIGEFQGQQAMLRRHGVETLVLSAAGARTRFPITRDVDFGTATWCGADGVVDIHGLLTRYLHDARAGGFVLRTGTPVEELLFEAGRVVGVQTAQGEVRAEAVIDASGAWAGRLGHESAPLPHQPLRRHLFITGRSARTSPDAPFVWVDDAGFYFRPEGDGLLFSPCDETPMPPCDPPVDPAAAELLGAKLERHAPALVDLPLRRSWACLRTFVPDRRPFIGADRQIPGLFHVSALGGYGMGTSAAVGELAATLLTGRQPDWISASALSPKRT